VDQLVSDLAIELKMLLEIPLLSRFKEEHPSLFNGQETTMPVDSSVWLGHRLTNPIATLLSMLEFNSTVVTKLDADLPTPQTP
jgi:hypothetical protein